ncbi:RNA-guided pseudouridylation complex pseudouridine synthase subunit Cbf5 [Candidatus Woesearchaeota archaeon]|nr:RNA-guided pseudouridylation complex pseudouridine synthase subunit Cbf5 [Candidatus Woesearchaeota archaeon]
MDNKLPFERTAREVLVRRESETSAKYGCIPEKRSMEQYLDLGIANIDKPKGPTSHQVSAYAQKILGMSKGGHGGTLDPGVTGVLPIAFGRATRIVQALLPAGKEYICIMHLHKDLEEQLIKDACSKFVGKIKQLPPIKSAVKREFRFRKIYYLNILEIEGRDVLFVVGCQAGTYIRKLCTDIGATLGCGAHMAELRRTKAGPFNESTLTTLQDLADAYHYYKTENNPIFLRKRVMPIEFAVSHLPKVVVIDTTVDSLCHGAQLAAPGIASVETDIQVGEMVAVMTLKGELICFGTAAMISKDMATKEKGIAVKTGKVFMNVGVYPRYNPNPVPLQKEKTI